MKKGLAITLIICAILFIVGGVLIVLGIANGGAMFFNIDYAHHKVNTSSSKEIISGNEDVDPFTDIEIEIIPNKISFLFDESKTLNLNIYEIKIDDNLIHNKSLINNFLYECQCALFLADITNKESFELIQKLISNIEMDKYPYLKKILIQSKYDQESNRKVSNLEFKEYLDVNKSIDGIEISSKDGTKIKELINIINNAVNESKNELPLNIVSETQQKVKTLFNIVGSFSIVLIGDSTVGKTCFLNRYFKNQFSTTLSNIGIDTDIKFIKLGNDEYKLTVWDTVGQERFRALPKKYFQNADGVLLLFDVTKEESFNNVSNCIIDSFGISLSKL